MQPRTIFKMVLLTCSYIFGVCHNPLSGNRKDTALHDIKKSKECRLKKNLLSYFLLLKSKKGPAKCKLLPMLSALCKNSHHQY